MVTFSTDCWAPGMDLHVRRRRHDQPSRSGHSHHQRTLTDGAVLATRARDSGALSDSEATRGGMLPSHHQRHRSEIAILGVGTESAASSSADHSGAASPARPATAPATPTKKPGLLERLLHGDSRRHANRNTETVSADASTSASTRPLMHRSASSIQLLMGRDPNGDSDAEDDPFGAAPPGSEAVHAARAARAAITRGNSLARRYEEEPEHRPQLHKKYGICDAGLIGRGASAVVRLARRLEDVDGTASEKLYAVKEFRKRRKDETEKVYIKKLTSEFCISASLNHPNVVKTVDLVQDDDGQWCEVMEYCPGGDLYHIIKTNCMTEVDINCCFRQLMRGIGYLHSMGVAHRDIKPENLLMDMRGTLKITDFGVSDVFRVCWEGKNHRSKGLCGSEPYIAPEEFTGREYDGRKVDIWACGIVYYAMRFQSIPFRQANRNDVNYLGFLERRRSGAFKPFLELPEPCRRLMYRILEPDTVRRITIEEILEDPWIKSIEICDNNRTTRRNIHQHLPPSMLEAADQLQRYVTLSEQAGSILSNASSNGDKASASGVEVTDSVSPRIEDRFRELRV